MMKTTALVAATLAVAAVADQASFVEDINSKTDLWVASESTRFNDETGVTMKTLLGANTNHAELKDAIANGQVKMVHYNASIAIPDSFDSETNWPKCASVIGDIRDQSNCGCCWAFGTSSAASDRFCIATDAAELVTFSAQDVCFCSNNNGCGGGFTGTALSYIQQGVVTGGQYQNVLGPTQDQCVAFSLPHCHHHGPQGSDPYPAEGDAGCPSATSPQCPTECDATAKAPHDVYKSDRYSFSGEINSYSSAEAIQQAIMTGGPIATAFTVYADFENYVSGIYHHVSGEEMGGHAVRFVGWGEEDGNKYWKVANSWNPFWGEKGYFRIVRGTDEGEIESQGIAPADDAKWISPHA